MKLKDHPSGPKSATNPPPCNTGGTQPSLEACSGPYYRGEAALVDSKGHCCHFPSETGKPETTLDWLGSDPEPAKESSRSRIRRRRQTSAKILRHHSPRPGNHKDQKRGLWYPVTACSTVPHKKGFSLEVRASGRVDRHGIMRCGSVWTCPECAQRIAAHRGNEIRAVIEAARRDGYRCEMLTFTLPHDLSLSFEICFNRLKEALRRFSSDGTAARRLRSHGFVGQVRSIEVTYSFDSGWHVHAHAVMVFEPSSSGESTASEDFEASRSLKKELYDPWKRAAQAAGSKTPSFKHGFDVRAVWSGNDYLAKLPEAAQAKEETGKARWGADAELSKAYMKEGKKSSLAIWQLLDKAETEEEFANLFRDYARATWGRSQIEWSRGKRNLRAIFLEREELSDEEVAIQDPDWVFADEVDIPDVGDENLIIERVAIPASDAWRARVYRFGSIDRACAAVEEGEALSVVDKLREEGWVIKEISALGWATELQLNDDGTYQEKKVLKAAEFQALWPAKEPAE